MIDTHTSTCLHSLVTPVDSLRFLIAATEKLLSSENKEEKKDLEERLRWAFTAWDRLGRPVIQHGVNHVPMGRSDDDRP